MVQWRCILLLAMLLLLPARIGGKSDDDDDEDMKTESEDEEEETEDDDDNEEQSDKVEGEGGRRAPSLIPTPKTLPVTRTTAKRPLECHVCAYKTETPIRSCLDPSKFRVHTMTCHSVDEKCFTSVMSKNNALESVVRGCRSGCVGSPETTCCELNRCNNQAFPMPIISPRALVASNKTTKSLPTTVLFFVTILLVLQTVVKVAFI